MVLAIGRTADSFSHILSYIVLLNVDWFVVVYSTLKCFKLQLSSNKITSASWNETTPTENIKTRPNYFKWVMSKNECNTIVIVLTVLLRILHAICVYLA